MLLLHDKKCGKKFIWCERIAVGTCAPSCWRTAASELLLVPSTRVRARSNSGHFQRAENTPGKLIHL